MSSKESRTEQVEEWQPDVYYFPTQVDSELKDIQNNFLGKTLTIIDTLTLEKTQKKAIKDLVRTVVKEQMIGTRDRLSQRLYDVIRLGMKPVNEQSKNSADNHFFFEPYRFKAVYEDEDLAEPKLG